MLENWATLRKLAPGKIDTNLFESDLWTLLATKDYEEKIGMRVKFNKLSKDEIRQRNFPEWGEIDISVPDLEDKNDIYLYIRLNNADFEKQFSRFIEDILPLCDSCKTENSLLDAIYSQCKQWKDFMRMKIIEKLEINTQQGLIGELLFLKYLFNKLEIRESITAWTGPDRLCKDFLIGSIGFEIKSKKSGLDATVKISSEYQLFEDNLKKLFLLVFTVDKTFKSDFQGKTLSQIVEEFRDFIGLKDLNCIEQFNTKLQAYGFYDHHDYSKDFWLVNNDFVVYEIFDQFPRITVNDINPSFISRVNYDLSINKLEEYNLEKFNNVFD
tara:strand:+ start:694 stop:1674 length:981 start_codon:yes stop_codon:yes gene_type:complete